jgi:hypothetical protein
MTCLVLLRTHVYNRHVEVAFSALRNFSKLNEPKLLIDVSNGDIESQLPMLKFEGARLQRLGIELFPERDWAWFSGDYALYCAFLDQPEHTHYVMIDYDVKVNFSVDNLLTETQASGYDLVAPYAGFQEETWIWRAASKYWFSRAAGCFFPVVIISRRLLLRCLEHRLAQSRLIPTEPDARQAFLQAKWVNCEAFVPSVALTEGYSLMTIQKLIAGWTYEFVRDVDVLYWEMPQLEGVPCAHPVFLKEELPYQVRRRLNGLGAGPLRDWIIKRANDLRETDGPLWEQIAVLNPELRAESR